MIDTLIRTWEEWDQSPGHPNTANQVETACQLVAEHLGIEGNTLRELIAHYRRQGMKPADAIQYAYDKLQAVRPLSEVV